MSAQIGFQKEPIDIQGGKVPFRGGGKPQKLFALRAKPFYSCPPYFARRGGGGKKPRFARVDLPSSNPVDVP